MSGAAWCAHSLERLHNGLPASASAASKGPRRRSESTGSRDDVFDSVAAANDVFDADSKERAALVRKERAERVRLAVERYGRYGTYNRARRLPTDSAASSQPTLGEPTLSRRDAPMLASSSSAPVISHRTVCTSSSSSSKVLQRTSNLRSSTHAAPEAARPASAPLGGQNAEPQPQPPPPPSPPPKQPPAPPPQKIVRGASNRQQQRLIHSAPQWWHVPEPAATAADAFDVRHSARLKATVSDEDACLRGETPERVSSFRRNLAEVRTNRYYVDLHPPAPAPPKPRARRPAPPLSTPEWDVMKSIWAPRAKWSESRSLYDLEPVSQRRFERDWERVLDLGLGRYVLEMDVHEEADRPGRGLGSPLHRVNKEERGDRADEVLQVREVLRKNWDWLILLFTYYASLGGDFVSLFLNQWNLLLEDCRLISHNSQLCKQSDYDRLFVAIDSKAARVAHTGAWHDDAFADRSRCFSRIEFVLALLHVAINRHAESGDVTDVSDALHSLLAEVLKPHARERRALAESNGFRRAHCYIRETDDMLRAHEKGLRRLFFGMEEREHSDASWRVAGHGHVLSLDAWINMLYVLGLLGTVSAKRHPHARAKRHCSTASQATALLLCGNIVHARGVLLTGFAQPFMFVRR
jgi:hypothetical protein